MLHKLTKSNCAKKREFQERTAASNCNAIDCNIFCLSAPEQRYYAFNNLLIRFDG